MMAEKYRLPEAFNSHEVCIISEREDDTGQVTVQLVEQPFYVLGINRASLTKVEPPLPPEPPNNTAVRIGDDGPIFLRYDPDCSVMLEAGVRWMRIGHTERSTWRYVYDLAIKATDEPPVRLDPFVGTVELPWKGYGVEVQQTTTDSGPGNMVHVSTKAASYGFAHLTPAAAREMAHALWASADKAEAAGR